MLELRTDRQPNKQLSTTNAICQVSISSNWGLKEYVSYPQFDTVFNIA